MTVPAGAEIGTLKRLRRFGSRQYSQVSKAYPKQPTGGHDGNDLCLIRTLLNADLRARLLRRSTIRSRQEASSRRACPVTRSIRALKIFLDQRTENHRFPLVAHINKADNLLSKAGILVKPLNGSIEAILGCRPRASGSHLAQGYSRCGVACGQVVGA
jgi:hypothetical protein